MTRTILIALLGGVVGWFLAGALGTQTLVANSGVSPDAPLEVKEHGAADLSAAPVASNFKEPAGDSRQVANDGPVSEDLYTLAIASHYRHEFKRGWLSLRDEEPNEERLDTGEEVYEDAIAELPHELGRRAALAANEEDALAMAVDVGNGLALIDALGAGEFDPAWEDLEELVAHTLVRGQSSGSIDGVDLSGNKTPELTAGVTVQFGPGVHVLDERKLRGPDGQSLPADITVSGAGMDATLLRIGDISISGDVERLTFRDMTLDADNDGLFDLRRGKILLDLERVRIVRFDAGHGGCTVFSVRGGSIIRARDCEIIGGYGRSPGNGDLFRNYPVLAVFENCHLELFDRRPPTASHKIIYRGCTFELFREDPRTQGFPGEKFSSCSFAKPLDSSVKKKSLAKELSDLFWQVGTK